MQHHLMLLSFPCSHVSASLFYLFCFAVDLTETAATIVIVSSDERKIVECLLTWLIFFYQCLCSLNAGFPVFRSFVDQTADTHLDQ